MMVNCAQNESPKENGNIAGKDVKEKVLEAVIQCSPVKKIEFCNELSDHEECSDAPLEGVRQRAPRIDPFSSPDEKELTKVYFIADEDTRTPLNIEKSPIIIKTPENDTKKTLYENKTPKNQQNSHKSNRNYKNDHQNTYETRNLNEKWKHDLYDPDNSKKKYPYNNNNSNNYRNSNKRRNYNNKNNKNDPIDDLINKVKNVAVTKREKVVIKVTDVTKPKDPSISVIVQTQTAHDQNSKPKSLETVDTSQNNKIPENKNTNYYKNKNDSSYVRNERFNRNDNYNNNNQNKTEGYQRNYNYHRNDRQNIGSYGRDNNYKKQDNYQRNDTKFTKNDNVVNVPQEITEPEPQNMIVSHDQGIHRFERRQNYNPNYKYGRNFNKNFRGPNPYADQAGFAHAGYGGQYMAMGYSSAVYPAYMMGYPSFVTTPYLGTDGQQFGAQYPQNGPRGLHFAEDPSFQYMAGSCFFNPFS